MVTALFWQGGVLAAPPTAITANGLGTTVTSASGGFYNITGGTAVGANLFHSFSNFTIGTGSTADFVVPSNNVGNILARVTGGASSIDGTITSTVGIGGPVSRANLFLLNPAGVMFTANAQVNLGGAFTVSSADDVKLNNNAGTSGIFYAKLGANDVLSSAPISAFGFTSATPHAISFTGSQITNPGGIHVIGGALTLDQAATLSAPSGNLTLFSAASQGEVPFSLASPGTGFAHATNTAFGNITMKNQSTAAIDGAGGGSVVIRGGHLVMDNSTISSANSGAVKGGNISVQADELTMQDGAEISAATTDSGGAGNVSVTAHSFTVDGTDSPDTPTGIFSNSYEGATGNSGSVNVVVINGLHLLDGDISGTTLAAGNGGDVTVQAGSISIDGTGESLQTGIYSTSEGTDDDAGNSGNVTVTVTGGLSVSNGGAIFADSGSSGNAGAVVVRAGAISLDDCYISAEADGDTFSTGHSGSVNVTAVGLLSLTNYASIDADSYTAGDAGAVRVNAGSLKIDTGNISSETDGDSSTDGASGDVSVTVSGAMSLTDFATIDSDSYTNGNAGNIVVTAASLTMDDSYITSESGGDISSTAVSGQVTVNVAGNLTMTASSGIDSDTYTSGNAGDVFVQARTILIDGSATDRFDGISSSTENLFDDPVESLTGNAGKVTVIADAVSLLAGGAISTSTETAGRAGDITLTADTLTIDGTSSQASFTGISSGTGFSGMDPTSATGDGGNLNLNVSGAITLKNGGEIDTSSFAAGHGGTISVNSGSLTLVDGYSASEVTGISAEAFGRGDAGSIHVVVGNELSFQGSGGITADTFAEGNAGDVFVQAGSMDIDGSQSLTFPTGISSGTFGPGAGGNVFIQAGTLSISGSPSAEKSAGITAQATGSGDGGNVILNVANITLSQNATISTSSQQSNGGNVQIDADRLILSGGSSINTQSAIDGGSIVLRVGTLVDLLDSQISAAANVKGGNVTIDPEFMVMDDSLMTSNGLTYSFVGQAGNFTIIADYFFANNSEINGAAGLPNTFVPGLVRSPIVAPDNEDDKLRESCARSINHEFSSLTVVGRGGTEAAPEELQPDFGFDEGLKN